VAEKLKIRYGKNKTISVRVKGRLDPIFKIRYGKNKTISVRVKGRLDPIFGNRCPSLSQETPE
jgi:hypothetical protein